MSNILYRMQIMPQEEIETRIIDSNEIMDECIEERQKLELKQLRSNTQAETAEIPSMMEDDDFDQNAEFTELGALDEERVSAPSDDAEPEVDHIADAQAEAERIITEARMEADEILVQAENQAEEIRTQAEALRSHAEGEGHKAGFDQGIQEATLKQMEWEAETEALRQSLQQEFSEKQATMEKDLVDVVCDVVEKVFLIQFGDKREIILHLLDNAISNVDGSKEFLIRVNEANCEFLRAHKTELQDKVGQEAVLDIVQDPLLDDSQCMIETDGGLFDCSMDVQMRNLIKDIKSLS